MSYIDKINNTKEIEYSKYVGISSLEKLAAYAIKYMNDNDIETTWTNVVIVTYKLFPRKFAISEDFIDFPNAERLNRTLMHLVPPKGRNYAIGSTRCNYVLTPLGEDIAFEVGKDIDSAIVNRDIKQQVISTIKETPAVFYNELVNSKEYQKYLDTKEIINDDIWSIYSVIPFTQKDKILKKLNNIKTYLTNNPDEECLNYINNIIDYIK